MKEDEQFKRQVRQLLLAGIDLDSLERKIQQSKIANSANPIEAARSFIPHSSTAPNLKIIQDSPAPRTPKLVVNPPSSLLSQHLNSPTSQRLANNTLVVRTPSSSLQTPLSPKDTNAIPPPSKSPSISPRQNSV